MSIDKIHRFLEEAKKMSKLPEEETEIMNLELDLEVIGFLKGVAAAWNCEVNDILVATLLAIIHDEQ